MIESTIKVMRIKEMISTKWNVGRGAGRICMQRLGCKGANLVARRKKNLLWWEFNYGLMHLLHELSVVGSMCLPKILKYYQAVSTSKKTILEEKNRNRRLIFRNGFRQCWYYESVRLYLNIDEICTDRLVSSSFEYLSDVETMDFTPYISFWKLAMFAPLAVPETLAHNTMTWLLATRLLLTKTFYSLLATPSGAHMSALFEQFFTVNSKEPAPRIAISPFMVIHLSIPKGHSMTSGAVQGFPESPASAGRLVHTSHFNASAVG